MNKTHRSLWNESLGAWVAASELTRARGKRGSVRVLAAVTRAGGDRGLQGLLGARQVVLQKAGHAEQRQAVPMMGCLRQQLVATQGDGRLPLALLVQRQGLCVERVGPSRFRRRREAGKQGVGPGSSGSVHAETDGQAARTLARTLNH